MICNYVSVDIFYTRAILVCLTPLSLYIYVKVWTYKLVQPSIWDFCFMRSCWVASETQLKEARTTSRGRRWTFFTEATSGLERAPFGVNAVDPSFHGIASAISSANCCAFYHMDKWNWSSMLSKWGNMHTYSNIASKCYSRCRLVLEVWGNSLQANKYAWESDIWNIG